MCGRRIQCFCLILFLLFSQWSAISYGDESPRSGPESILAKYQPIEKELEIISGIVPCLAVAVTMHMFVHSSIIRI